MRRDILIACLATAGCTQHHEHAARLEVEEYVASLPPADTDARVGYLLSFVRAGDTMLTAADPVENHVDAVMIRSSCMYAAYGVRAEARRREVEEHLVTTPERRTRWRRYVAVSSGRPSVLPDEETCNF